MRKTKNVKKKNPKFVEAEWIDDNGDYRCELFHSWDEFNRWTGPIYGGFHDLQTREIENIWSEDSDAEEGEWLDE